MKNTSVLEMLLKMKITGNTYFFLNVFMTRKCALKTQDIYTLQSYKRKAIKWLI